MEISLEEFRKSIPAVTLDDAAVTKYLTDSARAVKRDGVNSDHKEFDELQKFYALGLMQNDRVAGVRSAYAVGKNPEGISSMSVAGISLGFQSPSSSSFSSEGKTGYFLDYDVLLKKVRGLKGRIA